MLHLKSLEAASKESFETNILFLNYSYNKIGKVVNFKVTGDERFYY